MTKDESLTWAIRQLHALVHVSGDGAAYIRGTGTELAGFAQKIRECELAASQPGDPPSQKVIEEYQRTWRENNNKGPFGYLSSDTVNDLLADFVAQFFRPSAPQPQPRWIRQEDKNGCVVAAIAMIVGKSYDEVKSELRPKDLAVEAYTSFDAESYLYEHGYTLLKKWKHVCFKGDDRKKWPIGPFAPVHYVQVVNGPSGKGHAVVMLANGDVLDPWTDATPKKLTDYYQVNEIIGVFSVDPYGSAGPEPIVCSSFHPQFGQCVYNSGHKGDHLYAEPAEG